MPMTWLAWTIVTLAGSTPPIERMTASSPTRMSRSSGWARA